MMNDVEYLQFIDEKVKNYTGNAHDLASAIGLFSLGRQIGWRALLLISNQNTFRKYESLLGINFKEQLLERGKYSDRSFALREVDKDNSFWAVAQNRKKIPREEKALLCD